ncbi:recombinase family protein [Rhizorhapis suberifaciens]|uniref:Resolvase/invertase-type recombinase catalytic domain-containing protein n=1 Tax=Rhizorhapis suberifaciens TaxID=13656 RepID=A0A840HZ74_9SPHN|nr:recombinase family protein [Rhizorhapis suberifaciens]MBB4642869.1 hypothetical protein [Rhizorhapis suberifaciens]
MTHKSPATGARSKTQGAGASSKTQPNGGRWGRPELHRMLDQLCEDDVVVVWKLDRLSRSLKDLSHLLDGIETTNAGFRSLTESIDTITPADRMMMQMVGSFAEFERAKPTPLDRAPDETDDSNFPQFVLRRGRLKDHGRNLCCEITLSFAR